MDKPINDSKFQKDNQALLNAAQQVEELKISQGSDNTDYKNLLHNLSSNPDLALMQLFALLYASPNNATMGGIVQDKIGITGAQLKLNGALTTVDNDLNNMVNSNNDNPASLKVFTHDTEDLMGELQRGYVMGNIDPSTDHSLLTQLQTIRNLFWIGGSDHDPRSGFIFNDVGTKDINSFAEYQKLLGEQGDTKNATKAAKIMTDSFATNTQTTQTASAVLNNDMKTYSPLLQAIQQFDTSIAQLINAVKKASISHIASGS